MRQLLWCDPQTLLDKRSEKLRILRTLSQLFDLVCEAYTAFHVDKKYYLFDPHVGDNLCQIRACQVAVLAKKNSFSSSEFESLHRERKRLSELAWNFSLEIKRGGQSEDLDAPCSIQTLLEKYGFFFYLSSESFFLFACYFLTIFSKFFDDGCNTYIDLKFLCEQLGFSKALAENIVKKYQRKISDHSCEFVIETAQSLESFKVFLPEILALKVKDRKGRSIFPFFWASWVVIEKMFLEKIPQVLIFESGRGEEAITFIFDGELRSLKTQDLRRPCVTWMGRDPNDRRKSELHQELTRMGVKKILLATCALHQQYPSLRDQGSLNFPGLKKEIEHYWNCYQEALMSARDLGVVRDRLAFWRVRHASCGPLSFMLKDNFLSIDKQKISQGVPT